MSHNSTHKQLAEAAIAAKKNARYIKQASSGIRAYGRAGKGLSKLNTMRGGTKGFKGFVMEEMEAAEASARGRATHVLNNNGIADLKHVKVDGTTALKQMKVGYKPGQIDFTRYKGQTLVVDKGNPYFRQLRAEGAKAGVKVVEGHVTAQEAKALSDAMQWETKITGSKNAVVTSTVYRGVKTAAAAHRAGLSAAKTGATGGMGFSLGSNVVDVAKGRKTVGEAAADVAVDTVKAGAVSYGVGAAGSAIGSTAAGAAALKTAGTVAAAAAKAPVIGSAISAGSAATAAIASAGTAAATAAAGAMTGAVGAAGAAATSLAAGTALSGAVTAGAGLASAGAAALGGAVIAAAPVAVPLAVLGGICSLFFGDD